MLFQGLEMVKEYQAVPQVEDSGIFLDEPGVCFDPESTTLTGVYTDEISAHRAKRLWIDTLEVNFLLDLEHDFVIKLVPDLEAHQFMLTCRFSSACARYAFWRLTNNQAPEAQYIIETAHIPVCESRHHDILRAPDMRNIQENPLILRGDGTLTPKSSLSDWLRAVLQKIQA